MSNGKVRAMSWALVVALGVGCKATAAQDTPKAVALAYYDGIIEGDASKTTATFDLPSERTRAAVHAGFVLAKATMEMDDACTARFGKPMVGVRNDAVRYRREVEQGEFRIEGDTATLMLPSSSKDSIVVKKVNGRWKMADKSPKDAGSFMAVAQWQQYEPRVLAIAQKVSSDIRAGTYSDCQEAMTAALNLIADAQNSIMASDKNCEPTGLRQWRAFQKLHCVRPQYVCENLTAKKVYRSMAEDEDAKQYVKEVGAGPAAAELLHLVHDGRAEAGCAPDPEAY